MVSIDNNHEYKGICINGYDTTANIYNYCSTKMQGYDASILSYCKLDMCNLCCVTIDNIKKKSYSFSNVKSCYEQCSKGIFNIKIKLF